MIERYRRESGGRKNKRITNWSEEHGGPTAFDFPSQIKVFAQTMTLGEPQKEEIVNKQHSVGHRHARRTLVFNGLAQGLTRTKVANWPRYPATQFYRGTTPHGGRQRGPEREPLVGDGTVVAKLQVVVKQPVD